jgi:hypothetical protein
MILSMILQQTILLPNNYLKKNNLIVVWKEEYSGEFRSAVLNYCVWSFIKYATRLKGNTAHFWLSMCRLSS